MSQIIFPQGEPYALDQKVIILHKSIISHDNIKSINNF